MDELFFLTNSLWESLPKLEDITLNEIKVGLRPAVYDGNPIIGPLEEVSQDIICNFGHYRNGILLAPITSQIISQYILEENITKEYKFFPLKDLIYNFLVYHLKMKNLKNKYFINGKNFSCELKEPYLEDLIEIFLNKSILKESKIAVAVNNQMIERYKWKKKK